MIFLALSALVFALILFGVQIGTVDMLILGLLLFVLGHIFGSPAWWPIRKSQ